MLRVCACGRQRMPRPRVQQVAAQPQAGSERLNIQPGQDLPAFWAVGHWQLVLAEVFEFAVQAVIAAGAQPVAGGAAIIPLSIFDPVRPMPASIAAEMAEAPFRGDHYFALFATGIVLFLFTLLFNMLAFRIAEKHKQTGSSGL